MAVGTRVAHPVFLEALQRYAEHGVLAWHTPGHKQGRGASPALRAAFGAVLPLDVSDYLEAPDYDHSWDQVLAEAERLAARAFGAAWTRFLVNGTSGGIHAMLLGTLREGDYLIMPRAAHLSVAAGLVLSGAIPHYIPMRHDKRTGLPVPPGPAEYEAAIRACPQAKAVLVTYPNYYGMCTDLAGIAQVAHKHNMLVLVDEAHGAHYAFHPQLPPSALSCGADVVVQSAHKTLGALTQSSYIHAAATVDHGALDKALGLVRTTSRCALLLASLDAARAQMEADGERLWTQVIEVATEARRLINQQPGWQCLDAADMGGIAPYWDPCRLIIACQGKSGLAVSRALRRQGGMQTELADSRYAVALVGLGDGEHEIQRLVAAIRQLDTTALADRTMDVVGCPAIPPLRLSPRQAEQQRKTRVPWAEAVGRVATDTICPYPPGIPVLVAGEEITPEVAEYIAWARAQGFTLRGDSGDGLVGVCEA